MPKDLKYAHIFKMMSIAFVEIRANDSDTKNYALSNMFHNITYDDENDRPVEDIWDELWRQAKRSEITGYLQVQAEYAIERLQIE